MNRQLVAFLSLFSLVLVLSVYYVMLPSPSNQLSDNNSSIVYKDATTLYFETLDMEREEAHQEYLDQMIAVYEGKSDKYTIEEAFLNIANRKNIMKEESEVETYLKTLGYSSCYCEIEGENYIKVVVFSNKKDFAEIDKIIYQVQNLLNRDFSTFLVEFQD